MPASMQSKGDGEWPYSAPFSGLNVSVPSILLPPQAQDIQTSPSFSIVRGSIAAPWPYSKTLFGSTLAAGEYFLFATASGYVVTNLAIYQIQGSETIAHAWNLVSVASMPSGAFPAVGNGNPTPFIETNGCLYFSCLLGIYQYSAGVLQAWAVNFSCNYLTIFSQRMVVVGTNATSSSLVPSGLAGTAVGGGSLPAATYYAVVTAVFASGTEGNPSIEASAVSDGSESIAWSWTAVPGATSYNVYVGTASGEENAVFNTSTNSYSLTSYTAGTVSPPGTIPISPWTIAWSAVSTFSNTSFGSFNPNPNTDAGVVGGYDVLTNYSQGIPAGLINMGHSFYVMMTQGIIEVDPASNGTAPFTLYNYWQEQVPCGAMIGSVAQYGTIAAFITPDNVQIWIPGSQTPIGTPIMPYLRNVLRNASLLEIEGASYPLLQNPVVNSSFYTIYNELHYGLAFNIYGVPPQQATPPYPNQTTDPVWFGLLLDYNFATQAWTQQLMPAMTGEIYQIIGPPLTTTEYSQIPTQNLLIAGTAASLSASKGDFLVIAPDVFNQTIWAGAQCQGLASQPQPCAVGFPQTPVSAGHRPAVRRVRIEYSFDEMSCATQAAAVDLTVTLQGTITQNTGSPGGNGVATTQIVSIAKTIQVEPPGVTATGSGTIVPYLTATAYADMVLSCENPQVSLSWTDPSAHQRLLVHRVTLMVNDTKGTMQ